MTKLPDFSLILVVFALGSEYSFTFDLDLA